MRVGTVILVSIVVLLALSLAALSFGGPFQAKEQASPGNWVAEEQIRVYQDKVVLDIPNALWAEFTNSNSMDPFLDEDSHAIEISPSDPDSINIGDVISYESGSDVIIHRVVDKGVDAEGVYYIVKGDNNSFSDPQKVRFDQIHGVLVAIIY
ncbi:hypothetical protein COV20_00480 [Candidatus Woesearchaeota archaeon CG10_big_fil_rev_8_21_14_0_10_45_16]|nr:MAG: hypothetical protein COV20_00480 [Candidatus Woesearchaeota archaeon CG10_big_fil_rev_8_21_14_0_10_45_16]